MPPHVAMQLRELAQAALMDLTVTGDRVHLGRHYPINLDAGDSLAVHSTGEEIVRGDVGDLDRFIDLLIVGSVSGSSDFEDTLDAIAVEVEGALHGDTSIKALCQDIWPVSKDIELVEEGEKRLGQITLTFTAHVVTPRGDPTTAE